MLRSNFSTFSIERSFDNEMFRKQQDKTDQTKYEIINDVASKSAIDLMTDSTFVGNVALQRDLQKHHNITKSTMVSVLDDNGRPKEISIDTARQKNSKGLLRRRETETCSTLASAKAAIRGPKKQTSKKKSPVPTNSDFIHNKQSSYKIPTIPNASNRKHRNKLSEVPIEFGTTISEGTKIDGDFTAAIEQSKYGLFFPFLLSYFLVAF